MAQLFTSKTATGPRWGPGGGSHHFGGHASETIKIPEGVDMTKVEVGHGRGELNGLRFHLSVQLAEPADSEKIVGFYGRSDFDDGTFCGIQEFGIITAPKGVELPDTVYDLPELQNTDGGTGP
ncbi:hypothetical protein LSUE1_G003869 [Lachnellula suecica]|uniref:Jacalin-type lectin domain-containing protein n=1 Tax=Lachnellula suecica TaxID=602035 RepID=A0A8T9C9Q9_9HELO|nr:hypothetical protein LSUE1_G003869 [Lachnellula suecica]